MSMKQDLSSEQLFGILQQSHHDLMTKIKEEWGRNKVGIIYFDIIQFSEIERQYGQIICNKILVKLEQLFYRLQEQYNSIFYFYRMGDDFFLFIKFKAEDQNDHYLKEFSEEISLKINRELNDKLYELKDPIQLHTGYTLLYPNVTQSLESILYNATKQVIKQAKIIQGNTRNEVFQKFKKLISQKNLSIHYQPIVSLSLGKVFGYEALTRGPIDSHFHQPDRLFHFAEAEGYLYALEKVTRELAIHNSKGYLEPSQKLFININAQVINDPGFNPGYTSALLKKYNLSSKNIVFEITERSAIHDFNAFKNVLEHYKNQGFQIAIDDAGAGYSSLQAISELRPDYIKVDRSLIQDIDKNKVKENLLETFVNIARKMNSKVIAEGIETIEELAKITRLGVHFGQGYVFAKPHFPPAPIANASIVCIEKNKRLKNIEFSPLMSIGEITSAVKTFDLESKVSSVSEYFTECHDEMGAVIVADKRPIGLVMKEKLNQELVKLYGTSLYWRKPIKTLMDSAPLIVERNMPIDSVVQTAISRHHKQMYDFVIVVEEDELLGTVSIKDILDFMSNVKMEIVRQANPLSGLPGNNLINRMLNERLAEEEPFSLIYADIDHFKWFNDRYGFQRGDQIIKYLADVLQEIIVEHGNASDFIGHVGGDDFVVITSISKGTRICEEITRRFDQEISNFYDNPDENKTYIKDRHGQMVASTGLSISCALIECKQHSDMDIDKLSEISAHLKKKAKLQVGSCWVKR
jgi:diguanylate cyclase (GGDEF)-like protein